MAFTPSVSWCETRLGSQVVTASTARGAGRRVWSNIHGKTRGRDRRRMRFTDGFCIAKTVGAASSSLPRPLIGTLLSPHPGACRRLFHSRSSTDLLDGPHRTTEKGGSVMRRSPLLTLAVLAAFVSMISSAAAQTATGQITGTVRDATGAVMSGVKVVVTNQQTGLTRETKTGVQRRLCPPAPSRRHLQRHRRVDRIQDGHSHRRRRSPSIRSSASTCSSLRAASPRPSKW